MSDHEDDKSAKDKKPLPKRVVVTYGGEKKKATDVPSEILPHSPKQVMSNPVDSDSAGIMLKSSEKGGAPIKSQLHAKIPEGIAPRPASEPVPQKVSVPPAAVLTEPSVSSAPHVAHAAKETVSAGSARSSYMASPPTMPPPPPPPSGYESARGGINTGNLALFLSLLSTIAIIALIFYAYFSQQEFYSLKAQSQDEKTSVAALVGQAKTSFEAFENMRLQHQQSQAMLQTLKGELENTSQKMVALSHNREWVLSEVNYLVFMANQRLHIADDIPTAVMQLKSADERIRTLGDPTLLPLKQALQNDMSKLLTYPIVDVTQLWKEIGQINDLLAQLHFKTLSDYLEKEKSKDTVLANDPAWLKALKNTWQEFKSLIRITHEGDDSIPQALSLQEKAQVVRTLELLINEAQWSALNHEGQIYLNSLQSIAVKVQQYFTDNQEQQVLLNKLTQLAQARVDFKLPELTDTLNALAAIHQKQAAVPSVSPQGNQ